MRYLSALNLRLILDRCVFEKINLNCYGLRTSAVGRKRRNTTSALIHLIFIYA